MNDTQSQIIRQSSLNRATDLVTSDKIKLDEVIKYAQRFESYVKTGK